MRRLMPGWNSGRVWLAMAACLTLPEPDTVAAQDRPTFTLVDLAAGVVAAVVVADPPHYAFANSLVIDLGGELLVVDTQQSPAAADALIAAIRSRSVEPVRWVVNTHWHADHVYGNTAYRRAWPDVVFLTHRTTRDDLLSLGREQLQRDLVELPASIDVRRQWLASGVGPDSAPLTPVQRSRIERSLELRMDQLDQLRGLELVAADSVFDEALSLSGSARTVRLIALGPAHTRGDVVVWLPVERILGAGDLVEDAYPWVEHADVAGWARALEQIEALSPVIVLPAHGSPWRDPGARLATQRTVFRAAVAAACGGDASVPAELTDFRRLHGLPDGSGELRFWGALVEAARTSLSNDARRNKC